MLVTNLSDFLESVASTNTRKAYRSALARFEGREMTKDSIKAWVKGMRDRQLAEKTVKARLAALRSYLKDLDTPEAWELYGEVCKIKVRPVSKVIQLPANSEVEAAIRKSHRNHIDRLLLLLLIDEGLRVSEAVGITVGNVNMRAHSFTFRRKGGDWQTLPMSRRCETAMAARLAVVGQVSPNVRVLPITTDQGREIVRRYFPEGRVHPHTLRHVAGTQMLRKTGNLRLVQRFLGHRSINTTTIYTHLANDDLAKAIRG